MTTSFTINVTGKSEIRHPAELAFISVSVTTSGPSKSAVAEAVLTSTRDLEQLLQSTEAQVDSHGKSPLAHWSKTSLTATSHIPYALADQVWEDGKGPARQYVATITFDIRFRDFQALGAFGSRVSALPHVEVQSTSWRLTPETEASYRSQLRREAARDAQTKANDYADVLGYGDVRPVELSEGGAGMHQYGDEEVMALRAVGGGNGTEERDESPLEFKPEEVKMGMEVRVKFEAF